MKHLKPKKLLLAVALALGLASPALAQSVPDGYLSLSPYNEGFETATSQLSTMPVGWNRFKKAGSASYTNNNSGQTGICIGNTGNQNSSTFDFIITPLVKGDIKFWIKKYSTSEYYPPVIQIYKATKDGDTYNVDTDSDPLYEVPEEEWKTLNTTSGANAWKQISIPESILEETHLGFRIAYAYIDEFTASSAIIPINKSFEITAVNPTTQTVTENPNNTVTIGITATIKNTGNVSLGTSLDEKLKLTLAKRLNSFAPYEYEAPFATADIPLLAPNETAEIQISGDYPIPEGLTPNSSGELGLGNSFFALIDQFPNAFRTLGYIWVKPLKGIMNIRYDKNISKSKVDSESINGTIYYGVSNKPMSKTYHLSNSGPTDLTITNYESTNPDIYVEGATFPFTIAAGEGPKDLQIVIGGTPGIKEGTVKFILDDNSLALLDNVTVSGEIVDSNKFFANFESQDDMNSWYAPNGTTSWKIIEYTDTERNNNSADYYPEYNINNYRLENTNNNSPSHDLYSPKMSFTAGDKISFYAAKRTNSGNDVKLVVKYSPDRVNWTELGTISVTNSNNTDLQFSQGTSSSTTNGGQNIYKRFEIEIPESGEYYISFSAGYVLVDNFVGGTLVDVPYDIVSENAKAGNLRIVNNVISFDASFKNIGSDAIAAKKQIITLYANGVAVATAEASDLPVKQEVNYNLSYIPHAAGETNLFAELAIGDYKVNSPKVLISIKEEAALVDNQIGEIKDSNSTYPLALNYNNSQSEIIYPASVLADLKGTKITKISYPYYKGDDQLTDEINIWLENTTEEKVQSSAYRDREAMTQVASIKNFTMLKDGSKDDMAIMEFMLDTPFEYDGTSNLRVAIQSLGPDRSYKSGSFGVDTSVKLNITKNQNDSRSTFLTQNPSTSTNVNMPVIILSTEQEVPTISGTVKDVDGNGIEGATVTATAKEADVYYTTTTDSDGNWNMTIFQPDYEYTVSASDDDYITTLPVALDMEEANDLVMYTTGLAFDTINAEVVKGESDQTAQFDINIISKEEGFSYQGFQFDLTIPSSISIPENGITSAMTISVSEPKEDSESNTITYKVVGYDGEKASTELEGIVSITLTIPGYVEDTVYPINDIVTITGVDFSTPTGSDVEGEGYIGELIISKKIVPAEEIVLGALTLEAPSYSSTAATSITAGESITATVTLEPAKYTTDEKTDIQWTSSADGVTVELDDEGNLVITAAEDYQGGDITITGTIGDITIEKPLTGKAKLLGDANANGKVTVADVVTTANVAAAEGIAADAKDNIVEFCYPNANVVDDENGNINIDDVMGIVNIILYGEVGGSKSIKRHASTLATADRLVADNFRVSAGKETVINVCLDNSINYTGLQAFVNIPEGMKVTKVTKGARAAAHDMAFNISDSRVGVVLYSLTKAEFADSNDALFQLHVVAEENCEGISIDGIRAVDPASNGYNLAFDGGMNETGTTGIDSIDALDADARYFDINGIELKASQLQPGIYIRVKGDKTEKIVIR